MPTSEQLRTKLHGLGLKCFEHGKDWVAFAHQKKFYFVSWLPKDDFATLQDLIDRAEAMDEAAEEKVIERRGVERRLFESIRKVCDPDNMITIRARWAQDKAAGLWGKESPSQKTAAAKQESIPKTGEIPW